jgi:hypothetical protein
LETLRTYSEQVVLEVSGHDHFADLRYHSSWNIKGLDNTPAEFKFHNLIVAPGVSPNKNQNPGIASFEISAAGVPQNMKMEFLNLDATLGLKSPSYNDLSFFSMSLTDYSLPTFDA